MLLIYLLLDEQTAQEAEFACAVVAFHSEQLNLKKIVRAVTRSENSCVSTIFSVI